ncbi:MAG: SRPBCC family protein [Burkholderiales bacterium]
MARRLAVGIGRAIARGAILLLVLSGGPAAGEDYNDAQRARLRDGEILIEQVTNHEGIHGLRAAFLVRARPEAVWSLLTDYKRLPGVLGNVEELRVLDENAHGARVRLRVRAAWMRFDYVLQRDYEQPGRRLSYRRVEGDFRSISGEWVIRRGPDDEHQLVVCQSYVDIGALLPTALVRDHAAEDLRETARRMRQHLEKPPAAR